MIQMGVRLSSRPAADASAEGDPVKNMWYAVLDSLVEASSKEVMASTETKDAMAQIVNLLRRVWDRHTAQLALPQHKEDSWADKFCFLVESVMQKLGPHQFTDKGLTRNSQDAFRLSSLARNEAGSPAWLRRSEHTPRQTRATPGLLGDTRWVPKSCHGFGLLVTGCNIVGVVD